jgi:hypothetical protein
MKVFNFLRKLFASVCNLVKLDGLLHFLMCAIIVFTFFPILKNVGNAVIVATVLALTKEYFDVLMKRSNTLKQALKDILFDALGIGYAVLFLIYVY